MQRRHHAGGSNAARWLVATMVAVAAAFVLAEICFSEPRGAIGSGAERQGRGMFAVAGRIDDNTYGLFIVDPENDTICVYKYLPGTTRTLRLVAARNFTYDVQLDDYNTAPAPREIKKLVEQHKRIDE